MVKKLIGADTTTGELPSVVETHIADDIVAPAVESAGSDLQDNIDAEETARISGDSTNATAISTEASTRASADTVLQGNIDDEEDARIAADLLLIPLAQKATNNGVATLDGGGKVPLAQLPSSVMTYEGVWNAATNSPTLADGSGSPGQVYRVSVAGTQNLGSGAISFDVGDYVIANASTVWEKSDTTDAVASVNGQTGVVILDGGDISLAPNPFFPSTDAQDFYDDAAIQLFRFVNYFLPNAKGDISVGTADDTSSLLPVGPNGSVLTAESGATPGVFWANPDNGPDNLATNPTFETNVTGWSAGANATIAQSTTQAKFGTGSLRLTRANTTAGNCFATQNLTTVVGRAYTIGVWAYALSGKTLTLNAGNIATRNTVTTGAWEYLTVSFVATATSTAIYLSGDSSPNVAADLGYFDGVFIRQTPIDAFRPSITTTTRTANYTALANEYVRVDTTSGAITVTMPTDPPEGTFVWVCGVQGANTITLARGGTNTFSEGGTTHAAGIGSDRMPVGFQFKSSTGRWYPLVDGLGLVKKSGDTMTGRLIIDSTVGTPIRLIRNDNPADVRRWEHALQATNGDYTIDEYNDAGSFQRTDLRLYRGGTRADINGIGYFKGTGSPESVVTAPVGSRYVDTAATGGAVEWVKLSGSGNTGWAQSDGLNKVSKSGDTMTSVLNIFRAANGPTYRQRNDAAGADTRLWENYVNNDGTLDIRAVNDAGTLQATNIRLIRDGRVQLNGTTYASGTGSPEGVLTASIGARYVDTAATNGAVEWVKHSGAGNTGWRCVSGDTGIRRILSWTGGVQDGSNQLGTIDTSQFSLTGDGSIYLRRIDDQVRFRVVGTITKTNSGSHQLLSAGTVAMPAGFRPNVVDWFGTPLVRYDTTNVQILSLRTTFNIFITSSTAGPSLHVCMSEYGQLDAWPTSLPGVAV